MCAVRGKCLNDDDPFLSELQPFMSFRQEIYTEDWRCTAFHLLSILFVFVCSLLVVTQNLFIFFFCFLRRTEETCKKYCEWRQRTEKMGMSMPCSVLFHADSVLSCFIAWMHVGNIMTGQLQLFRLMKCIMHVIHIRLVSCDCRHDEFSFYYWLTLIPMFWSGNFVHFFVGFLSHTNRIYIFWIVSIPTGNDRPKVSSRKSIISRAMRFILAIRCRHRARIDSAPTCWNTLCLMYGCGRSPSCLLYSTEHAFGGNAYA